MAFILALYISAVAAIVPTVLYCIAFYWADRYEREPRSLLIVAFVWGAVPAVVVSLIGELSLASPFDEDGDSLSAALVSGVLVAPVIEELAKGAALAGLFIWKHNEFDGVLDGLIYGALIGFGFAMTENFLYFIGAYDEGGFSSLTFVIVLRAIIFGLNHAFYTSLTGIGFGLARNVRNRAGRVTLMLLGLCAAIAVHALHNFGVVIASVNALGFLLSLFIAACGIGLLIAAVVLSWNHERAVLRMELAEELGNALTADELIVLTGRWRQPLRRRLNDNADRMALYAELAIRKRRLRIFGPEHAEEILDEIVSIRNQLSAINEGPEDSPGPVM